MSALLVAALGCVLGAVALAVWGGYQLFAGMPAPDRRYQDPLPVGLRLLWPLTRLGTYYLGARLAPHRLEKIHRRLQGAAVDFLLTPEQFIGTGAAAAVVAGARAVLLLTELRDTRLLHYIGAALGGMAVGYAVPWLWLSERRKRRVGHIRKELPSQIDFIALGVEGGLNLNGALRQTSEKGQEGALPKEFGRVLRDVRAGLPRADALRRMAERLDMSEIAGLTGGLIQAERAGASLAPVLRAQAAQRGEERFQRAEKAALEAPIKMMMPLVVFFFPLVFCLIGFFIYVQFMHSGAM